MASETQNIYLQRINRAIDHVLEHIDQPLSVEVLAEVACFSQHHFHRIFTGIVGETVGDRHPTNDADISHRHILFELTLAADTEATFYVHYRSTGPMQLPLTLWSSTAFLERLPATACP